jgi:CheY-like chemotaxis protein
MALDRGALSGIAIVFVDDDSNARTIVRDVLKYFGANVTAADSAGDALLKLRRVHPDVVIADMRLGDHSGSWLLREARNLACSAPFVAVSGYDFDERALRAEGFATSLRKPLNHASLIGAVLTSTKRL